MDHVRGVADQRDAGRDVPLRVQQPQREGEALVGGGDFAEVVLEGLAETCAELRVGQRHELVGLGGVGGPDDRRAPVGERQERERPARHDALPCRASMRLFGRHVADDRALRIAPAAGVDAGPLAQRRVGAFGGDDEFGFKAVIPAEAGIQFEDHRTPAFAGVTQFPGLRFREHAGAAERVPQRRAQQTVLDDVPELRHAELGGVEREALRGRAFPDLHARVRARAPRGDAAPRAEAVEETRRSRRQRVDARVVVLRAPRRGRLALLNERDVETASRERERGRGADHAAADHHDIVLPHLRATFGVPPAKPRFWRMTARLTGGSRSSASRPPGCSG